MKLIFAFLCFFVLPSPTNAADFHGYPCTQDCSGHKAGYAWAEKKYITKRENCGGKSNSFIEGCYAWVEDQAGEVDDETAYPEDNPADQDGTVTIVK
ncbi:MAG: hypothetical protein ABW118_08465 [Candidatus Thiodiazotropha sp.]